jgi:hypothetical protein
MNEASEPLPGRRVVHPTAVEQTPQLSWSHSRSTGIWPSTYQTRRRSLSFAWAAFSVAA